MRELRRIGKRIVIGLDDELFLILHLMIAGRLRWRPLGTKITGKVGLAAFDFSSGTLLITEASSKKRAALHFETTPPVEGSRLRLRNNRFVRTRLLGLTDGFRSEPADSAARWIWSSETARPGRP